MLKVEMNYLWYLVLVYKQLYCFFSTLQDNQKIDIEIDLVTKDYNATPTTTSSPQNKYLHFEKAREKEV